MFKIIKKTVLNIIALLLFAFIGLSATNSYAIRICFSDGSCYESNGSCSDVHPGTNGYPTCSDAVSMFHPASDYILSRNGQAWVVTENEKIPVCSDKLDNLFKEISSKYPVGKILGEKELLEIQAEYDNFFKKSDDGKVSNNRLQALSRETGLRILDKEPNLLAGNEIKIHLIQPPPNQLGVKDLWKLDITNTTSGDIEIYLTGTVTESKKGLIVDGKSKVFTVKSGKTAYDYNNFKSSGEVNWKDKSIQEIIGRIGNVPEGIYTICVAGFYKNGEIADQESCIEQSIKLEGSIMLIEPEDNHEFTMDGNDVVVIWPKFIWTPLPGAKEYTLKIVEVKGDQSPEEAIKRGGQIGLITGIARQDYQLRSSDFKLEIGKKYAWMVKSGSVESEVYTFKIMKNDTNGRETLIGSTDELVKKIIKQLENKRMYTELQAFAKKVYSDTEQFRLLKEDMVYIGSALNKGDDAAQLSKALIEKHPELQQIFNGSGYNGEPGWIIFLIIFIIVVIGMYYG